MRSPNSAATAGNRCAHIATPLQETLAAFYASRKSFAETLAASRRNLAQKSLAIDATTALAFRARLRSAFPEELRQFQLWTGADLNAYLRAKGNEFNRLAAGRLMELLLEYKPLNDRQWSRQTPAQRRMWIEAEKLEQQHKTLLARGDEAQFSPEWIELMLAAGGRIQWRPHESEPVAPYVTPATPPTCTLTAAERARH